MSIKSALYQRLLPDCPVHACAVLLHGIESFVPNNTGVSVVVSDAVLIFGAASTTAIPAQKITKLLTFEFSIHYYYYNV